LFSLAGFAAWIVMGIVAGFIIGLVYKRRGEVFGDNPNMKIFDWAMVAVGAICFLARVALMILYPGIFAFTPEVGMNFLLEQAAGFLLYIVALGATARGMTMSIGESAQ
jgi:hypothetical protein